ncbi:TRAP transporter small permease subunit [Acuticoccus kandeliae]|uniref:TRAP transporter small permease subunit n=1 Tax=Acuticoccus kandeliae TaxID=2073160 RepID=UPI000D3EBF4D|nr:TRAP transporter small permease [Acuticoccus kandeliae]
MIDRARTIENGGGPLRWLRAVSRAILIAGGLMIVAACVLIVVEVGLRQLLDRSLGGVDELAGFALAVGTSWAFGAILIDKAHVRIDTLYSRFGDRVRTIADIVGLVGTLAFAATLLLFSVEVLRSSVRFGTTSQGALALPVAVPQAMWVGGLAWFVLVTAVLLVASVFAVLSGNWRRVGTIAGARGIEDEIRSEVTRAGALSQVPSGEGRQ